MGIKKQIVYKKLEELHPYANNPRFNDEAVEYVKRSIQQFHFQNPMIISSDGEIICGHTRYKASMELGLKEVPCIVADDLNEEQIKAFRLADNKVSEKATWDFELLDEELQDIININMEDFDFKVTDINWDDIEELTDSTYQEPESNRLQCPMCNGIDYAIHFKKVTNKEEE